MKFRESATAHRYLDGLRGIEIGGSAHNSFGLRTWNVDYTADQTTVYKRSEIDLCGEAQRVDVVAEGMALPFLDHSLDFVVSSHVLEHMRDTLQALLEWYRVIRPGGYLFMILPHKERTFDKDRPRTPLSSILDRHGGREPIPTLEEADREHMVVWVTEDLEELCTFLGWRMVHVADTDDKVGNGFTVVVQK